MGGAISVGLTYWNTQGTLTSSFVNSKLTIRSTSLAIMPSVIYTTFLTVCVLALLVGLLTLLVSHKIAGPMYRFEKDIQRVATGDLKSKIRIRKGDQFHEVAESLNDMVTNLNRNLTPVVKEIRELAENDDLPPEIQQSISELETRFSSRFKL